MSYLNQAQDPRRKAAAVAATVGVHAALGLVVVTGLTVAGVGPIDLGRKPIVQFPVDPPPPPPTPTPTAAIEPTAPAPTAPMPPIPLPPAPGPARDVFDPNKPIVPEVPYTVPSPAPTLAPAPSPRPAFAPKAARPSNEQARWISNDDYPSRALRAEAEGLARYRLIVGTDGRVSSCEITTSTGNAQLDEATCRLIARRARFEPATDETGAKVLDSYTGTVRWQIPD